MCGTLQSELILVCSRLALAFVLAGIVGLERQRKARGAGLRTHVLVCLASTVAMTAAGLLTRGQGISGFNEMSRVAQGLLTGIGFIGAGTIITVGFEHRGLTTAAMLWFVAAVGISVGAGLVVLPVCATALALFVTVTLEYVDRVFPAYQRMVIVLRMPRAFEKIREIEQIVRDQGFWQTTMHVSISKAEDDEIELEITAPGAPSIEEMAEILAARFHEADKITISR